MPKCHRTLGPLRRRQGQSRLASSRAQETAGSTGPTEVRNVGVTHTFCISKARHQLGYRPREFCLSETLHVPKITRIKTWRTGVARHEALMWTGVLLCFCLLVLHSVVVLLMMF
ncbi:unnamed protein product [Lampetra planeri]